MPNSTAIRSKNESASTIQLQGVIVTLHTLFIYFTLIGCQDTEKEHPQRSEHTMYCNEDPTQNLITDDMDCDGYNTEEDCDDNDASVNPRAEDIWYDEVDQNCDELSDYDQDQDGIRAIHDCDDTDDSLLARSDDDDCDGIPNEQDCEGDAPNDMDCDGILTSDDCDDLDASSTIVATDGDCDGAVTSDDCNDSDADLGAIANDLDCDGVLGFNDCDDNDAMIGSPGY